MTKKMIRASKLIILPIAVLSLGAVTALAQDAVYEGFDIPPGPLDFQSGATSTGWDGAWDSQLDFENIYNVSETGLSYEGLETTGGSLEIVIPEATGANGTEAMTFRRLANSYSLSSTGSLWFSALVRPSFQGDPLGGGFFQVGFSDGTRNSVIMGTNWSDTAGDQWFGGGARAVVRPYSGIQVVDGETAFLVMELNFDEGEIHYYLNPTPGSSNPGTPFGSDEFQSDLGTISHIVVWAQHWGEAYEVYDDNAGAGADWIGTLIDEIRVGSTWASVSPTNGNGGPVDPDPEEWAGYTVSEDGWVNTEDFMGMLYVENAPWIWVSNLNRYIYLPEEYVEADGAWSFAFKE